MAPPTKDQADLSLNRICVINNSQLRIEFGCCWEVPGRLQSSQYFSVLLYPREGDSAAYLLSLHLHLQEKLVFDWREDGGH